MEVDLFHRKIVEVAESHRLDATSRLDLIISVFITFINTIFETKNISPVLKMTRMTVLFEGFFHSIADHFTLNKDMVNIRLERWGNHYGTPTITFLLTYHTQIEQTKKLFELEALTFESSQKPWEIVDRRHFVVDKQNNILINEQSTDHITMPTEEEKTGQFLKTHNLRGGFTTTPCDPVSQKFIEYTSGDKVILEIGAAFGTAALQALEKNATVFCNDIDLNNLAVVRKRHLKNLNNKPYSVTGDDNKLILIPGKFPDHLLGLPKNFFDAVLICRVLHFFTGDQIEQSLKQLSSYLKLGGKLFVVCETPFLKNWQQFIPEYEKRVNVGQKWPGEITNADDFENTGRVTSLPKFVHWITKEILERSLLQSKFGIEYLSYIDRRGQFPNDLLLDGRESIGAVAIKPY